MPARNFYPETVKNALVKDGWRITDDPLILSIGKKNLFVDLGAEKLSSYRFATLLKGNGKDKIVRTDVQTP